MIGWLFEALWAVLVWIWHVDPPVMTLLGLSVACGLGATLLYPRDRAGTVPVRVLVPVRRRDLPPPGEPASRLEEYLEERARASAEPAPVPEAEPVAAVVPLRRADRPRRAA